ncbi:MAG: hypothetical protein ACO25B_13465, partial [Chitinophagaceae bacterium]
VLLVMENLVQIELSYFSLGMFFTFLVLASLLTYILVTRVRQLTRLDYDLVMPPVPMTIQIQIQNAEKAYYSHTSWFRKLVENVQDILSLLFPGWVFRLNFSIGKMRMKPQTIRNLIPWAIDRKFLKIHLQGLSHPSHLLAYFAMQPFVSRWQAAVLIAYLREIHPQLQSMDWATIQDDERLVQKLYSGYMGAGGDWEQWKSSLEPGREAIRRFSLIVRE